MGGRQVIKCKVVKCRSHSSVYYTHCADRPANEDLLSCKEYAHDIQKRLTKADAELHNIEEGLKRLDKMLVDNFQFACWDGFIRLYGPVHLGIHDARRRTIEAPTLSLLIDAILTGGK